VRKMRQSKNNILLLFAIFCSLLMLSMPMNVMAISSTTAIGFEASEGGASGLQFPQAPKTSIIKTASSSGSFYVYNALPRSGANSFRINGAGYWNFSYSKSLYLTNFTTYLTNTNSGNFNDYDYFLFYNKTMGHALLYNDASNRHKNFMVCIRTNNWYSSTPPGMFNMSYADSTGVWQSVFYSNPNIAGFDEWYFRINDIYGDTTYYYNSLPGTYTADFWKNGTSCNTSAFINNYRIDRCLIIGSTSSSNYMDDVNITTSDSYTGIPTSFGCLDTSGWYPVGSFGYSNWQGWSKHISTTYNSPVTTTIKAVELRISTTMGSEDYTLSHYSCTINNYNLSSPTCIDNGTDYDVLQWTCNIALTNEYPTFDFCHGYQITSESTGPNKVYWDIGIGSLSQDLNGDGVVGFKWSDNTVLWTWQWKGIFLYFLPTYGAGATTSPYDLGMRFWDTGMVTTKTYNYTATLGLSHYSSKNTTGYIYDLSQGYNMITGAYTLSTTTLSFTINLYKNNTKQYSFGFPISCRYPGDGFGFSPDTIGKYKLQLNSTHALANVTAWVIGIRPPYDISTSPSITDQFLQYSVIAYYHNPQGYTGAVSMDTYKPMLNNFLQCMIQHSPLTNNQTTTFPYQSNGTNAEYWGLYTYINSIYGLATSCSHYIRIPSIYTNTVYTYRQNYLCSSDVVTNLSITITGTHMFPGGNVNVYVNGVFAQYVGENQRFTFPYSPGHFGAYQITMYLNQNSSNLLLCNAYNFTVSSSDTIIPGPSNEQTWFSFIPTQYYILIAIGIIIVFAFIPLSIIYTIASKLQSSTGMTLKVPGTVMMGLSFITSLTGYFLTIMWGLMPWWTVFVLMFILIIIFGIFYYSRKNTSETNDTE